MLGQMLEFQGSFDPNWFVMSLIKLSQKQEESKDKIRLFIEHYLKYIVSIN